jgi:catechol 2,3-dioxygenase-like lactoylglutathione lyase family enzyme
MPLLGLDHINITAPPELLAACRVFYVEALGLSEGFRPPFSRSGHWLYAGGKPVVHLVAGESEPHPAGSSLNHVAFTCSDMADVVARLEARGIAFRRTTVPATGDEQLFLVDPAGVPLELRFQRGA